ncbi:sulfur carrier protein ThiS [Luteimicrobium sp. NPDC057192]|uniref:sulfur carrier protein ThiS n=1 Tax=Luteimicrobium sp. NPDC057192 TaxID=3346042 RepID=UPI0036350CE4
MTPPPPARTAPAPTTLVNGEPYPLDGALPVADLVARLVPAFAADRTARGIAVAVDDAVVPRSLWETTAVLPGARVEVVGAVQGG